MAKVLLWDKALEQKPVRQENKWLLWLSAILLIIGVIAIAPNGDFRDSEAMLRFFMGMAVMSLGFVLSWGLKSLAAKWFWLIAIATRLLLLFMYPGDDIWRYVWEGYIQTQGFNPYDLAPNAAELIPYRTSWWSEINHHHVSAIYPPLTQLGFRSLATIVPHFLLFKISFIICDFFICYLLTRKFTYLQATLYAWNPLVIYSFAGGGHYDSWFILPLVAAWLCCDLDGKKLANWFIGAFFIGLSIAIKWISLPLLGFLSWQAWRKINFKTAIIVLICGLAPFFLTSIFFCNPESCYLIPTSSTFVDHGRSAEFIPYFLGKIWQASYESNRIFALPLGLAVLFLLSKARNFQQFTENYFFALLTISPIIHGWYFTWIIPFAVATKNFGVRLVSISALVYFVLPYRQALGHKHWRLTIIQTLLLWLPFVVGYLWTKVNDLQSSR